MLKLEKLNEFTESRYRWRHGLPSATKSMFVRKG